ncbi:MAG: hypothetical protein JWL70_574 [Acidimicrobiia bacterium]|nr:hypothetical protein [Acidimicrobiia bacterium]
MTRLLLIPVLVLGLTVALLSPQPAMAATYPKFTAPVVDDAGVVPDDVEARVNQELLSYQQRSTNQIAVAVIRTTGDRSLEDYTIDLARQWGVGQSGKDNGVLILVAMDDRQTRIEVGRGVEAQLTDAEAGQIVDQRLRPLLASGDVGGAVEQATQAVRQALGDTEVGTLAPAPPPADRGSGGSGGLIWFLPLLVPFGLLSLLGRRRRGRGGRGRGRGLGMGMPIIFGGGWGGGGFGGGGFGGGGGGFGGGGGGGFGGGGASGGW